MPNMEFLEEFKGTSLGGPGGAPGAVDPEEHEAAKKTSYEQGYSAGWDDAVRADGELQNRITAEFASNLQDLGFTFHEARAHVMRSMESFLNEVVNKFLPEIAARSLGPMIIETLLERAGASADTPVDLTVPVGMAEHLRPLIAEVQSIPIRVVEEPALADGQVFLRTSRRETRIDLTEATEKISLALADMYEINHRSEANG